MSSSASPSSVRLHAPRVEAQADALEHEGPVRGPGAAAAATDQGLHASEELARREGLGQVVVGAQLQPAHALILRAPGRDHDDRHVAVSAQLRAQAQAVLAREHEVEQDHVVVVATSFDEGGVAFVDVGHDHPVSLEVARGQTREADVVLDEQGLDHRGRVQWRLGHAPSVGGIAARGGPKQKLHTRARIAARSKHCFTVSRATSIQTPPMLRRSRTLTLCLIALTLPLAGACTDETAPTTDAGHADTDPDADTDESESQPTYTWHGEVAPLVAQKCAGCHVDGSIAPFALTNYAEVSTLAPILAPAIESEAMPPWSAAPGCNNYEHDRSLSAEEREILLTWIDEDVPEGDPSQAAPLPEPPPAWVPDTMIEMPEAYTPTQEPDDYRCFLVDGPELAQTSFVTGLEVYPGEREIVHHLIAFLIDPEQIPSFEQYDEDGRRPGLHLLRRPDRRERGRRRTQHRRALARQLGARERAMDRPRGHRDPRRARLEDRRADALQHLERHADRRSQLDRPDPLRPGRASGDDATLHQLRLGHGLRVHEHPRG